MTGLLKKTVLGGALAATALAAAAPAEAQYRGGYGGYRHHDGIGAGGAAVLGGIVGLGLGAAIASSNHRDRYYDDRGYYGGPAPRGYYYDNYNSYPRNSYYNDYRYEYRPRCYVERRWDGYWGRPVDVRVCR